MGILDELIRKRKEEEEEEEEERGEQEEKQQEEGQVKGQKQQQQQQNQGQVQGTQQAGVQQIQTQNNQISFDDFVRAGEIKFLTTFPQLRDEIETIKYFARQLMLNDYQTGKFRYLDFFDYMIEAWNKYREGIISAASRVRRLPEIKKVDKGIYTMEDYYRDYVDTLVKKVKFKDIPVEEKRYEDRGEISILHMGEREAKKV